MKSFDFTTTIQPDWIDYNDHLRDAYYGAVASLATDQIMDEIGIDEAYRNSTKGTVYTLEDHRVYLNEIKGLRDVLCKTYVLDCDPKRFHIYQEIGVDDTVCAVVESMMMHVIQDDPPRSAPMPDQAQAMLEDKKLDAAARDAISPRAGPIGIRRK